MYFTNEELDQYVSKIEIDHNEYLINVVPRIIESLRKNPNNYLAFGVYWYHVKKVIQELSTGDDWFYGDFHDQLIMEMSDHGNDFRNVVAALIYADSTDYFSSSSHAYTWKGDPRNYILEDDDFLFPQDIEKAVATENAKGEIAMEASQIDFSSALGKPIGVLIQLIDDLPPVRELSREDYDRIQRDIRENYFDKGAYQRSDYFMKKLNSALDYKEEEDIEWALEYLKEMDDEEAGIKRADDIRMQKIREEGIKAEERSEKYWSDIAKGKSENYRYQAFLDTVEDPSKITSNAEYQAWMSSVAHDFKEIHGNSPLPGKELEEWQRKLDEFARDRADKNLSDRLKSADAESIADQDKATWPDRTIDDVLAEEKAAIGDDWEDTIQSSIINEYYDEIETRVKSGGKISQNVFDSLEDGKKRDFMRKYGQDAIEIDGESEDNEPIKIEGKLNQGLKDYFTANGIPEVGTVFENNDRLVTLKEITPRGDVSDVKMSYRLKGVDKEFPLTDIPAKG